MNPFDRCYQRIVECLDETTIELINTHAMNLADQIVHNNRSGKLIAFFGNGGSAADSQHWSAELVGLYSKTKREPVASLALTTDTSFITAYANDTDYSFIFLRQIESLSSVLGVAVGLSTSGSSKNVILGLEAASNFNIRTYLITGASPILGCDFIENIISFPSSDTATIQTLTQIFYHAVSESVEWKLFNE